MPLCDCYVGVFKVVELGFGLSWVERQGMHAGDKISVIQRCRNYVLFYLDNSVCAIDMATANKIVVEEI